MNGKGAGGGEEDEEMEDRGRFQEAATEAAAAAAAAAAASASTSNGGAPVAALRTTAGGGGSVPGPPLLTGLDEVLLALDDVCKKHPQFKNACEDMGSLIASLEPLVRVIDKHALRHSKTRSNCVNASSTSASSSAAASSSSAAASSSTHQQQVQMQQQQQQQQQTEQGLSNGDGGVVASTGIDIVSCMNRLRAHVDEAREMAKTARRKCEAFHGLFRQNCLSKKLRSTRRQIDSFARDAVPLAELLLVEVNIDDVKTFREELRKKLEACKARVNANDRSGGTATSSATAGTTSPSDSVEMRDSARRIRQLIFTKSTSSDSEAFLEIQEECRKLLTTGEEGSDVGILQKGWVPQRVGSEELYGLSEHVGKLKAVLTRVAGPKVVVVVGIGRGGDVAHPTAAAAAAAGAEPAAAASAGAVLKVGGVGKTSLAKAVFQDADVRRHFTGGLLWVDVRRSSEMFVIQRRLWKQIAGAKTKMEGDISNILKRELGEKRSLIVFDDVWDPAMIAWAYSVVSSSSRILITTRDENVVAAREGMMAYKLPTLSSEHSVKLFCRYAFGSEEAPPRFESLLENVCKECAGLPIALKVVGASLHGKGVEGWKYALRRLQSSRTLGEQFSSTTEVVSCLRFAFDGLAMDDPRLQDLFLDFAAFPKNEIAGLEKLLLVWSSAKDIASEDEALALLAVLIARSLVEQGVDGDGKPFCRMHGVLQDMALQVTSMSGGGGKDLKGKGHGVLSLKLAAAAKPGTDFDMAQRERIYLFGKAVNGWLDDVASLEAMAESESRRLPAFEARKMSLMNTSLTSFELPISMPRLEVLMLRKNLHLVELSEKVMGSFNHLRVLDLSNCPSLYYLPPLMTTVLSDLRILDLGGCWRLRGLPDSIGNLKHLRVLNLHKCKSLRSVPGSLGQLINLHVLDMYGVEVARVLPFELGQLTALERLDISGLGLYEMPIDVGNLKNLRSLSMRNNHLEYLPDELNLLDKLISLDVSSNRLRELPFSFNESLDNLTFLDVSCNNLKELPSTLGLALTQLTILNISYNPLETLPSSIGMLDELRELQGRGTSLLRLPPSLSSMTSLKVLKLGGSEMAAQPHNKDDSTSSSGNNNNKKNRDRTGPASLGPSIDYRFGRWSSNVTSAMVDKRDAEEEEEEEEDAGVNFQPLRNLVEVDLEACNIPLPALQSLMTITCLKSLTFDCRNLKDARGIDLSGLQSLEYLRIGSTIPASLWQSLGGVKKLKELELFNLATMVRFARLDFSNLQQLEVLKLTGSTSIMFPGSVSKLAQLRELFIKGFGRLTHCDNINFQGLSCLEKATWWGCSSMERLPKTLGMAGKLVCIVVGHCPRLSLVPKAIGDKAKKRQLSLFTYNVCEPIRFY